MRKYGTFYAFSAQGAGHKRRRQSGGGMGSNCIEICQRGGGCQNIGKKCRRLFWMVTYAIDLDSRVSMQYSKIVVRFTSLGSQKM